MFKKKARGEERKREMKFSRCVEKVGCDSIHHQEGRLRWPKNLKCKRPKKSRHILNNWLCFPGPAMIPMAGGGNRAGWEVSKDKTWDGKSDAERNRKRPQGPVSKTVTRGFMSKKSPAKNREGRIPGKGGRPL